MIATRYVNGSYQSGGPPAMANDAILKRPFTPATPALPARDDVQSTQSQQRGLNSQSPSGPFFSTVLSQSSASDKTTNHVLADTRNSTQTGQARST